MMKGPGDQPTVLQRAQPAVVPATHQSLAAVDGIGTRGRARFPARAKGGRAAAKKRGGPKLKLTPHSRTGGGVGRLSLRSVTYSTIVRVLARTAEPLSTRDGYLSSHTSSKRQLLKMLLWFSTNPFICGCQH